MKRWRSVTAASLLVALLLVVSPMFAWAEDNDNPQELVQTPLSPIIITEVQTGSATARADEFIELHNTTNEAINLRGWQLRYVTASATSTASVEDPTQKFVIADDVDTMIPAKGYYVLYTGTVSLPQGVLGESYDFTIPATAGSLVLLSPNDETCQLSTEDALAWGTGRLFGEGYGVMGGSSSSKDRLFQRYITAGTAEVQYVETSDNAHDFVSMSLVPASVVPPSPGMANVSVLPATPATEKGSASLELPSAIDNPLCTPPEPDPDPVPDPPSPPDESPPSVKQSSTSPPDNRPKIPAGNAGLKSPQLSELLPNPGAPKTDANDEFIELYNANDARFELSGYVLEVGTTTKRRYTFPTKTFLEPRSFKVFFSADTHLALSNTSSQVRLIDPAGRVLVQSESYQTAKDDQSWVLADGLWQWSAQPTPNAINVLAAPAVKAKQSSTATQKSTTSAATNTAKISTKDDDSKGQQVLAATTTPRTPLHPGVLALVGGFAVLYGAYEYRRDVANKFYQFRRDRAARHAARHAAEGRGGD